MRYFEGKAILKSGIIPDSNNGRTALNNNNDNLQILCDELSAKCMDYSIDNADKYCGCVTHIRRKDCRFIFSGNGSNNVLIPEAKRFWKSLELDGEISVIREIGATDVANEFHRSSFIDALQYLEKSFGATHLDRYNFSEHIIKPHKQPDLSEFAESRHIPELKEEAKRISACCVPEFTGHPVHYIFEENNIENAKISIDVLVSELMKANRLQSGRIITVSEKKTSRFPPLSRIISDIYENICGGTIVIQAFSDADENEYAGSSDDFIETACKNALKYRNKVLTIFTIRRHDKQSENTINSYLNNELSLINFRETAAGISECESYLNRLAREKNIHDTSKLMECLDHNKNSYFISELDNMFDNFYSDYLRTSLYPAYANCLNKKLKKIKAEGKAADELAEMIGLEKVKELINKSVNYFQLQKLYMERDIKLEAPARSMIFTGNPGTAKTTVARLTAKIFKDNGLLENGSLIEVGRSDLVGKYVGWTAPKVKAAFQKAQGSILFIDEAYSLVDDRNGSYGDEAINTIVQEMENHRDDTIVIFAGYPDKMEQFMNKNPGLRSRIAFHVDFPDYTCEELLDILKLMVKNRSMELDDDASEKALDIFREAVKLHDFGNGRFVRNLLEQAIMNMAQRLSIVPQSTISDKQLTTLLAEDFTMPQLCVKNEDNKKIGF